MSWSDETRCLYCDGKLPLYRKLTNGQFCSTPHQKAYWKEQERLAVEVLHRTHDALMAYRPQGDIDLIIGPTPARPVAPPVQEPIREERIAARTERPVEPFVETAPPIPYAAPMRDPVPQARMSEPAPPPFADFLKAVSPEEWAPQWTTLPLMRSEEPVPCELFLNAPDPSPLATVAPDSVNQLSFALHPVHVPVEAAFLGWVAPDVIPIPIRPSAPALVASLLKPYSPELEFVPEVPPEFWDHMAPLAMPMFHDTLAGAVPVAAMDALEIFIPNVAMVESALQGVWTVPPPEPELVPEGLAERLREPEQAGPIPAVAGWCHRLASFASVACTTGLVERETSELEFSQSPQTPVLQAMVAEPFSAGLPGLQKLPLKLAEVEPGPRPATLTWFRLGAFNPAQLIPSSLTPIEPGVRMAGGCRYTTNRVSQVLFTQPVEAIAFGATGRLTAFPALTAEDRRAALQTNFAPDFAEVVDLSAWKSEIAPVSLKREPPHSREGDQTEDFPEELWLPALRLQPLKWVNARPLPEIPVEEIVPAPVPVAEPPASVKLHPHLGQFLLGFWKNAPRDLRLLMFAIPALLALAFHPSLPKVHVSTVQATEPVQKNVGQASNGSWTQFKQVVSERAAIALDEDFRSGLDDWASPGGNATEWSFDANGFVRPGSLALYSPSLSLADYQAQFLGLIDQKSLSWVVRAADFSNYYVVKLVVRKPGPLTTLGLTRYAVINGKPQDRVDAVVPFTARPDMLYRVRMDVRDDSYVLAIQGQMVDAWSEPRLKKGGIGFFSARGEGSRVRWLQVTHQYDMLGRLCSYLAPYDQSAVVLPTETTTKMNSTKNNGSWQR